MESVTKHTKQVRWSPSCLLSRVFVPSNTALEPPHAPVGHSVILTGCLVCSPSVCLIALQQSRRSTPVEYVAQSSLHITPDNLDLLRSSCRILWVMFELTCLSEAAIFSYIVMTTQQCDMMKLLELMDGWRIITGHRQMSPTVFFFFKIKFSISYALWSKGPNMGSFFQLELHTSHFTCFCHFSSIATELSSITPTVFTHSVKYITNRYTHQRKTHDVQCFFFGPAFKKLASS